MAVLSSTSHIVNIYLSGDPVHDRVLTAFYEGCAQDAVLIENFKYEESEVAVIFGVYKSKIKKSYPRGSVFRQQRAKNLDVIVLETGYINRGDGPNHHYAAGFNGLNGRADFRNKSMPPERFEALGVQMRPYSPGENVLVCAQVPWDASVDHTDHKAWIIETVDRLKTLTTRPIVFRPHPLASLPRLSGCGYSTGALADDLAKAHCVVTFNSNVGVDAAIWGKPVFAFDEGSMALPVANRQLERVNDPEYIDRKQWSRDLAFCQWTPAEMREGKAWTHLYR